MKLSHIFLFKFGHRRIIIGVAAVCCLAAAAGGWWITARGPVPVEPAETPGPPPQVIAAGTVDRSLELHRAGRSMDALAELLSVANPEEMVERPEAAAAAVELLAAVGLEEDADRLTRMVVESTMRDLDAHIAGLTDIARRLYEINDLQRSLAVEEKLRIMITELADMEPEEYLLRAFQVRLWAGYVSGFAQWDMVAWLTRGMMDLIEDAAVFPSELRAELYGHLAQALMERWEGRDPAGARTALDRALALTKDNGWLYYLSAMLRQEDGDPAAADDFSRALTLLPELDEIATAAALADVTKVTVGLDPLIELDCVYHDLSPDGRYVIAVDRGRLTIHDTVTGDNRLIEQSPLRDIGHVAWSPDGDQVAMLRSQSLPGEGGRFVELAVLDVGGTEQARTIIPGERFSQLEGVSWAPDGGRLAVWGEPADGSPAGVYAVDLETGEVTLMFSKSMLWCEEEADWSWSPDGSTLAVLGTSEGYPGSNARVWLVSDGDREPVACDTLTEWNPGIVAWSTGGIVTHWARDSWSVTPTKIVIISPDGMRFITGGRSMDSMPAWSSSGQELAYFSRPPGVEDWLLVFTDTDRTWEARFAGNWRWWRSPIWSGDTVVAGIGPNMIGVFRLSGLPGR